MPKRLLALFLAMLTVSVGCASQSADPSRARAAELSSYSGQELYTAVFFGVGPAHGLVPSVASYIDDSVAVGPEKQRSVELLVRGIEATSPDFFAQFAKDIRSGDRVAIRDALLRAGKATEAGLDRMREISAQELATGDIKAPAGARDQPDPDDATGPVAVSVAIVIVVAAVIAIAVIWVKDDPAHTLALDQITEDLAALSAN